jgi:hypothetical protein
MEYIYDDGGRALAGYRGDANDCVTRSIAIATRQEYQTVYDALTATGNAAGNKSAARTGVPNKMARKYMAGIGWKWHPTMGIGTGCTTHLRADELPTGRLVVSVSRHSVAVIDGVIHDTHDPCREGTRCVYGYYTKN